MPNVAFNAGHQNRKSRNGVGREVKLRCENSYASNGSNGVNLNTFGRGDAAIDVRYASNSDHGGESQRNVAKCRKQTISFPIYLSLKSGFPNTDGMRS